MLVGLDSSDQNQQPRWFFQLRTIDDRQCTLSDQTRLSDFAYRLEHVPQQWTQCYALGTATFYCFPFTGMIFNLHSIKPVVVKRSKQVQ